MSNASQQLPDPARSKLRATVEEIDRQMAHIAGPAGSAGDLPKHLQALWADLVAQLALGPEPALRPCPSCHRLGRAEATVCGYCWTATPVAE